MNKLTRKADRHNFPLHQANWVGPENTSQVGWVLTLCAVVLTTVAGLAMIFAGLMRD
jgi:hypothetical protein